MKKPKFTYSIRYISNYLPLASYTMFGKFHPAVYKKYDSKGEFEGYGIRVITKRIQKFNGSTEYTWDYFELDKEGVVTKCPRGHTKQYKGTTIDNIEQAVEEYKDKHINE